MLKFTPIVTTPINNIFVGVNAADTSLNLINYFDDPSTTGLVAHFNLANTTIGNGVINVVLFDQNGTGAPKTVQNFRNYVNNGSYTNSIIHRSIPGFIVQGGGFTVNNLAVGTIPANAPVQNEFSTQRSNVRGTIAMAKLGNDPNSATNQWFFNLADNSTNLNNQNGGFTVFGQVLSNNDLATIDAISAVPTYNGSGINSAFTNLPLIVDNPAQPAINKDNNFIRYSSITVTQEDELKFTVVGNSKPTLVTPIINNNQLSLDYLPNQTGTSNITLRATNLFGDYLDYQFSVTVLPTITLTINPTSVIENGATADTLIGGVGNDSLYLGLNDNAIDNVNYVFGNGVDTVYQFVRGVGGDKLNFTGITAIDVLTSGINTQLRISNGIVGDTGFGTGQLLVTLSGTSGFIGADVNVNLFGANFLFS